MSNIKVGYCLTGSYCTFKKAVEVIRELKNRDFEVFPIMSENAYKTDTRFGKSKDFIDEIESICGKKILSEINTVEPIGPQKYIDVLIIAPCTGNTLSKMANGITDTAVTMAAKASLRNAIPVVIALSTNDGLSQSAKNLGILLTTKNIYFVPLSQDDPINKPTSLVANFEKVIDTAMQAIEGKQIQPLLF
jgi:dipicolinate synthase subunit B